ncbi:uncharacterized protein Z519_01449 [Cladophialophora bantiana CBS 173.52]|uniref:Uncharacterized protein n=1 Tax=Cladophialophora bantiana (strain ATCC 10958 / CBS 173.52 / CDC B-1940 / NIH 8579) TaxID=1442370 RepID=A0A0D2I3R4_CLAB1|nr:uncharacterized protein Z519_01449 [Cladophialophora bantiana CBS 173.52]KIW97865.1 hypothetical protein Z519_01449 [Cladophialophora bantiana CBS 173.52]
MFAGYINDAKFRQNRRYRYKSLAGLTQSEGRIKYLAEVLNLDNIDEARVLQLWPHCDSKFVPGTDPIYIHKVSSTASYEVKGRALMLTSAKVIRTKNGIGHLRGNFDRNCKELRGDFKVEFRTTEGRYKSTRHNLNTVEDVV